MAQTAILLTWKAIVWIMLGTGTVSAAVLAFAGWLLSRSTKFFDSYTSEVAKAVARRQNLDALIEETRKLTKTAETIKAQLSHENWDRQTRWTAKRDLYRDIAESLGDLRNAYVQMKGLERLRLTRDLMDPTIRDLIDPNYGPELDKRRHDGLANIEAATQKFTRCTDVAPLMIPDEPYKPLREFKPRKIRFETQHWESDFEYNILSTQWALYHFQTAARADLGFDPMVWKPTILTGADEKAEGDATQEAESRPK